MVSCLSSRLNVCFKPWIYLCLLRRRPSSLFSDTVIDLSMYTGIRDCGDEHQGGR